GRARPAGRGKAWRVVAGLGGAGPAMTRLGTRIAARGRASLGRQSTAWLRSAALGVARPARHGWSSSARQRRAWRGTAWRGWLGVSGRGKAGEARVARRGSTRPSGGGAGRRDQARGGVGGGGEG